VREAVNRGEKDLSEIGRVGGFARDGCILEPNCCWAPKTLELALWHHRKRESRLPVDTYTAAATKNQSSDKLVRKTKKSGLQTL
jgi:hypothetical protein